MTCTSSLKQIKRLFNLKIYRIDACKFAGSKKRLRRNKMKWITVHTPDLIPGDDGPNTKTACMSYEDGPSKEIRRFFCILIKKIILCCFVPFFIVNVIFNDFIL